MHSYGSVVTSGNITAILRLPKSRNGVENFRFGYGRVVPISVSQLALPFLVFEAILACSLDQRCPSLFYTDHCNTLQS